MRNRQFARLATLGETVPQNGSQFCVHEPGRKRLNGSPLAVELRPAGDEGQNKMAFDVFAFVDGQAAATHERACLALREIPRQPGVPGRGETRSCATRPIRVDRGGEIEFPPRTVSRARRRWRGPCPHQISDGAEQFEHLLVKQEVARRRIRGEVRLTADLCFSMTLGAASKAGSPSRTMEILNAAEMSRCIGSTRWRFDSERAFSGWVWT